MASDSLIPSKTRSTTEYTICDANNTFGVVQRVVRNLHAAAQRVPHQTYQGWESTRAHIRTGEGPLL